jgi:hypothetical protein
MALAVGAGFAVPAQAQSAGDITYTVNQTIGGGSVVGQIVTDGHTGVLSASDILNWNLQLNGVGATFSLTKANSTLVFVGDDLTAVGNTLKFNYSAGDGGFVAFQANSPGVYSGWRYWCNNTNWFGCAPGASVAPGSHSDPSAQYAAIVGNQVIASAMPIGELQQSIVVLANARTGQMIVIQSQSMVLLGQNEQVSCSSCGGGDMTFGSLALSGHGRKALTHELTLLGGVTVGEYQEHGADVRLNAGGAVALRYDPSRFGRSRPYGEVGLAGAYQDLEYTRAYGGGALAGSGDGATHGYDLSAYARVGWVDRLSPRDEAAASVSVTRLWQHVGGYAETANADNPFAASVPAGTDTMSVAGLGAQYTHLFGLHVEADLNGGVEWAYQSKSGLKANISGAAYQADRPTFVYYEAGGRLGYRVNRRVTLDAFVNSTLAPKGIGSAAHGGFGFRLNW